MKLSAWNAQLFWLLSGLKFTIKKSSLAIILFSSSLAMAESSSTLYYLDKQALEDAKSTGTVAAIDNFIQQNPNSVWLNNATYYRDKQALDDAKSTGSIDAIGKFIQKYPNSPWLNNAIHTRDKTAYNLTKKAGTRSAFEEFLKKYPNSKWKQKVENKLATLSKKELSAVTDNKQSTQSQIKHNSNESVSRALAIYESINKENAKKTAQKELQIAKLQMQKDSCYILKDKVRQYGERRLWYVLDDTGNRTYLTDEEVSEKRDIIDSLYAEKCSKLKL